MIEYEREKIEESVDRLEVLEYHDLLILVEESSIPLNNETKKRVLSSYVNGDGYEKEQDNSDSDLISNLVYLKINHEDGMGEYDIITKQFEILETDWFYLPE